MNRKQVSFDIILQQRILPLYFHPDAEVSIGVLKTLYAEGIRSVEYTNRGEAAFENFRQLLKIRDAEMPGLQLGIGTIKTAADATKFMDAGADFIISPALIPAVAETVGKTDLLWVPGCMTTSEIVAAEQLGATFVKLFPGNLIGPSYVGAIKDIFPDIYFMPTGGVEVDEANISAWFKSGVCAVGMGSKLISKDLMEKRDYTAMAELTRKALQIIKNLS